jgi:hypothetical protein
MLVIFSSFLFMQLKNTLGEYGFTERGFEYNCLQYRIFGYAYSVTQHFEVLLHSLGDLPTIFARWEYYQYCNYVTDMSY